MEGETLTAPRTVQALAIALVSLALCARAQTQVPTPLQVNGVNGLGYLVLNSATEGQAYSYQFTATGGIPPYTWSVIASEGEGLIPLAAGLSLNPSTGLLSGTPTVQIPVTSYFLLAVSDNTPDSEPLIVPVGIKIFPPLPLTIHTTSLPAGNTDTYYTASIQITGGVQPYSINISGLPQGLTAAPNGVISGSVHSAGSYPITATVSDVADESTSVALTLNIYAPPPVSVTAASASVPVSLPYSLTLSATGGNGPYTWTLVSGTLPPGLTLHAAGYIDGSPTATGQYQFSLEATDSGGGTATANYSIQVTQPPLAPPTISSLPLGYVNLPYQQQILNVSGGTRPYTFSLQNGSSLPAGLTLEGGSIAGIPASVTPGQQFTIIATDSSNPPVSIPITFTLAIAAQPVNADLTLNTAALSFTTNAGSQTSPLPQNIVVQATDASTNLGFSVSMSPSVTWLSVGSGGTTPDSITVGINQGSLPAPSATPYTTSIIITCQTCSPQSQTVGVSLLVTEMPGTLAVQEPLISFVATGAKQLQTPITLDNTGGGSLGIGEITSGAPWCTVGTFSYTVAGGASMPVEITVDPSTLTPGFYRTAVTITTSGGNASVPVDLLVTNGSVISLSPAGVRFDMVQGYGPPNAIQSFTIGVPSGAAFNWTATALPGAPWLQLATQSGTAAPGTPGVVNYSVVPSSGSQALGVGVYYGTIRVSAQGVADSPFDFEVILDVKAASEAVEIDPEPAGMLFVTAPGASPPDQFVNVYTTSANSIPYAAGIESGDDDWLSVAKPANLISWDDSDSSDLGVDATGLGPGVYRGGVSYSVSGGEARTVNVTLVVQPVAAGGGAGSTAATPRVAKQQAAGACSPTALAPTQTGLANNFSAPVAWPTALNILLVDNCGNAITNGQVVTTFSNGDPPLALPLVDATQGLYSATWTPHTAGGQVNVMANANAPGFPAAAAVITGAVPPNAAPLLAPDGAVHPFDPETGGPLAPGTVISIYGSNLSPQVGQPSTIPLPTNFNSTQVIIGGIFAPLFYVSPTQINAQIPSQLSSGNQYQVIVTANGAISEPETIELTQATPGIAAFPDGTVIAQHADGSLVSTSSPATPGEYLVTYLLGLGDTTNPVPSGDASPGSPFAEPLTPVTLLLNNNSIPLAFVGLTPGLVGLYQLNFQVPAGLTAGSYSLQVEQGTLSSNTVTMPVQP